MKRLSPSRAFLKHMFLDDSYEVIHIYSTGNTFLGKNLTTLIVRTGIFKIQPEVILKII